MKKRTIGLVSAIMSIAMTSTVYAAGWQQGEAGWWYATDAANTTWYNNGWNWVDGDGDGTAECYYFKPDGYIYINTTTPDGFTVDANGAWTIDGTIQTQKVASQSAQTTQLLTASTLSAEQIAKFNNPSEDFVIRCLNAVPDITGVAAATEDNDPNHHLHKEGGYTSQVFAASKNTEFSSLRGDAIIDEGTDCGASVEVYTTPEYATKRNKYLSGFDGSVVDSGSHVLIGTTIIRTAKRLTATQQKNLENAIVTAMANGQ